MSVNIFAHVGIALYYQSWLKNKKTGVSKSMIIDFHAHIFPEKIRNHREDFFSSEPAFKLLYESPRALLVGADDVIKVMDAENVDISVVFGFPWTNSETYRLNNDYIIEAVQKYPDRFVGFACFDLNCPDAAKETERCLDAGLVGIGELAFYQSGIDDEALKKMEPVMALCAKNDLPVLIHTNEPVGHIYPGKTPVTMLQIYNLAEKFPENKIVLAHWGGGIFFFNLLKKAAKGVLKNIWYDTAASPYLYDAEIFKAAVELAGVDKIVFGSDYPLLKPSRYYAEVEKSGVNKNAADKILGGNAAELLKL